MKQKSRALLFAALLAYGAFAGMTVASAQALDYSPIPGQMQLAQSKTGPKGINPCAVNGRTKCGSTCCTKNQRCGDGKCHAKGVTSGGGAAPVGTQQNQ